MSLLKKTLQFIFPPVCVVCDHYAPFFCEKCRDQIDFLYYQPRFKTLEGLIDDVQILGFFTPPLSTVIKSLKYQSLYPIGLILGDLLYQHLLLPINVDCVTAVPLHAKRLRQRGYNQAELIAQQVAKKLGKIYQPLLIRQRHTQNLASVTNDQERAELIKNAFTINPIYQSSVQGKNILLIDDVVTTGSTLAACTAVLKETGVSKVFATAVAHE